MIVKTRKKTSLEVWKEWVRTRRVHWYGFYKRKKGCARCGYNKHERALCFAHIDPDEKNPDTFGGGSAGGMFQLARKIVKDKSVNRFRFRKLIDEIRKCEVLCMNCHAIETDERDEAKNTMETYRKRVLKKITLRDRNLEDFFK